MCRLWQLLAREFEETFRLIWYDIVFAAEQAEQLSFVYIISVLQSHRSVARSIAGPPAIPVLKVKNSPRQPSKFPKIPVVKNITFFCIFKYIELVLAL